MKKLGFGIMRLPKKENGEIDYSVSYELADSFIEKGYRYFDTAYVYLNGEGDATAKRLLTDRHKRGDFVLATKLPSWRVESHEQFEEIFESQLERTGLEYIDYYLLHDIEESTVETFEKYDAWSIVLKKKAEGKIKKLGFSFHGSPELLERLLTERGNDVDFVQLQINYADWEDPKIRSKSCYEIARRFGKDIIVMEPVKGGSLATLPEKAAKIFKEIRPDKSIASWAMRFVASLDGVIMVLSGMNSFEQLNDNISVFEDPEPFSEKELEGIKKVNEIILAKLAVKCTGCRYCVDSCPSSLDIPRIFALYNEAYGGENKEKVKEEYSALENKASSCISCDACADKCPQHIKISAKMSGVAKELE